MESGSLALASLERGVAGVLGLSPSRIRVGGLEDISPGIGTSRVFRVFIESPHSDSLPHSLILKIPDWKGESLLDSRDPWLPRRERAFFDSGLAGRLRAGLRTPTAVRIEDQDGCTWIWMEDVAPYLERRWHPENAVEAARRSALLDDTYRREVTALATADWLEREGYAAYAHQVPLARKNLDRVRVHPIWSQIFSANEIARLHCALDLSIPALAELRLWPLTLVHGDFHIRNLGFDPQGNLVCIDWAHVGLAPLGSDVAVLASLYHAFGGAEAGSTLELDREAVAAYAVEAEHLTGERPLLPGISRAFALWHVTRGLHVRLGPGLSHLMTSTASQEPSAERAAADIREGCHRALHYLAQVNG